MQIEIDLGAYRHNLGLLQQHLAPSSLMAVLKDDAYGHGLDRMLATALGCGITQFAVLDISTGLRVRELAGTAEIQLFAWFFSPEDDFSHAIEAGIELGISHRSVLDKIAQQVSSTPARIHLKVDSGLHRNGSSMADWPELVARARELELENRISVVGVWTHIGEASDDEDTLSQEVFENACEIAREAELNFSYKHLAASAASFARSDFRYDFSRVGGFTYGIAPGDGLGPLELGLLPVMRVTAEVVASEVDDPAGTLRVGAGFLQGIPDWCLNLHTGERENLPRVGFDVLINSKRLPILRVDAQTLLVDSSAMDSDSQPGDDVTLFGSHLRGEPVLQEWADALGTVGEELVVRIGPRGFRGYTGDQPL